MELLTYLPVLSQQLSDAVREANSAATRLGTRFQEIVGALHVLGRGPAEADEQLRESLLRDLAMIVMDLQFEDRLSQRVRHVAHVLDMIGESADSTRTDFLEEEVLCGSSISQQKDASVADPTERIELF